MPFYDVRNGPVVLEIPPAGEGVIVGSIDDAWQTAIEDVGPAGADKGKGGKYLILPPGTRTPCPVVTSPYAPRPTQVSRCCVESEEPRRCRRRRGGGLCEADPAVSLVESVRSARTVFIDAIEVEYDATIPYDMRFFESLDRMVQNQPWLTRDKVMIDLLKSIGIEKGKPFAPRRGDQGGARRRCARGARLDGNEIRRVLPADEPERPLGAAGVARISPRPCRTTIPILTAIPSTHAAVPIATPSSAPKHLGTGQYYLMTIRDRDGKLLDGGKKLPAHGSCQCPGEAVLVSDRLRSRHARADPRHAMVEPRLAVAGHPGECRRLGRRVLGPKAPEGKKPTGCRPRPAGGFEVLFRFYGPEKALFDKSWVLPDIEAVRSRPGADSRRNNSVTSETQTDTWVRLREALK